MKYIKQYKEANAKPFEISKEEARRTLEGYWKPEALDEIFDKGKGFRLFTPFAIIQTETDDGFVPMAGYYGVCEIG